MLCDNVCMPLHSFSVVCLMNARGNWFSRNRGSGVALERWEKEGKKRNFTSLFLFERISVTWRVLKKFKRKRKRKMEIFKLGCSYSLLRHWFPRYEIFGDLPCAHTSILLQYNREAKPNKTTEPNHSHYHQCRCILCENMIYVTEIESLTVTNIYRFEYSPVILPLFVCYCHIEIGLSFTRLNSIE